MHRILARRALTIGSLRAVQAHRSNSVWVSQNHNAQLHRDWITQARNYAAPAAGNPVDAKCWHCQKHTDRKDYMICDSCGYLQDVNEHINYFDILNCQHEFNVEAQHITRQFRQLQALVHPDKFSNKTAREQTNSADWSSLINKAYKTLSVPIERGQYMLMLKGERLPEDNSALDKTFLMEMMERNEEVDEADTAAALQQLNEKINIELKEKVKQLSVEFTQNSMETAKAILVEMKYLLSIQKTIKKKEQSLM